MLGAQKPTDCVSASLHHGNMPTGNYDFQHFTLGECGGSNDYGEEGVSLYGGNVSHIDKKEDIYKDIYKGKVILLQTGLVNVI